MTLAETNSTLVDGRRIAYAEYGDPTGNSVVFCHGTPGSRLSGRLFAPVAERLGVRVIAPDRPGYGRSTPWPDRTLADVGTIVEAVLEDAGVDRAGAIGFSGGGPHSLALAATRQDRVGRVDVISGAVPPDLADRPLPLRTLEVLATRTPRLLRGALGVGAWAFARAGPDPIVAQYTDDPTTVPESDAEIVAADFREAFARHRQGLVTESRLFADDWGISLSSIDRPVRCWHGRADDNVRLNGVRRLQNRLPESSITVLDTDHLGTLLSVRHQVLEAHA